jgi:GntR family transcriptional regulator, transcriptional repressor for pyruvate dehydrogenase complex
LTTQIGSGILNMWSDHLTSIPRICCKCIPFSASKSTAWTIAARETGPYMADAVIALEPVVRSNLTSQVVESIKAYITANDLAPGARLPGERELARTLGVSRAVTREALKALEAVGILRICAGNGIYTAEHVFPALVDHISFALLRSPQEFQHLLRTRMAIEIGALEEVLEKIDEVDLAALELACVRLESAESVDEYVAAEMEFHGGIIAATRNPLLVSLSSLLREFFLSVVPIVNVDRIRQDTVIDANRHREILDALRRRDLPLARSIISAHIQHQDGPLEEVVRSAVAGLLA